MKCKECSVGRAKQKSVPKVRVERAKEKGLRLLLDVSSVKRVSLGGSKFWL